MNSIRQDLYSRQILTLGKEIQERIKKARILVIGARGVTLILL
jgi:molybdopterin/thiamine biosynthesis adenylyltransferase